MSDLVQSGSHEDTSTTAPLEDENEDLERGLGPREVEVITVDMKSPSDTPRQRPDSRSRGTFIGLGDSLHSSGNGTSLGLDLDLVGSRSGEDGEDKEHPTSLRQIPSTLTMRSAASGYSRRPSIHDTGAMDELRQSLNRGRPEPREKSISCPADSTGSIATMATRKSSNYDEDDEEAQDQNDEEETETDPHSIRFRRAIMDACHDAFGIIGVDVWLHDEEEGGFHNAPGGYYRHKSYKPKGYKENMALERIEDENCVNFVPPTKQIPGAGLAGEFSFLFCRKHASSSSLHSHLSPPQTKATSGRRSLRPTALTSWERTAKTETSGATRPPS